MFWLIAYLLIIIEATRFLAHSLDRFFLVILVVHILHNRSSVSDECLRLDGAETCYSKDTKPYRFYGTKTTYYNAAGNKTLDKLDVGECTPKVLYLLSRHAIRYPGKDDIEKLRKKLPALQKKIMNSSKSENVKMCQEDVNALKKWDLSYGPNDDNRISLSGEEEAKSLARRLKQSFPSILDQPYSADLYTFEYTKRERTRSSAEAFAQGLFPNDYGKIQLEGMTNDEVLQFHKNCKEYVKKCNSSLDLKELKEFENGPVVEKLVQSISKRLGFSVDKDEIDLLYKACSFGHALEEDDAWCSVFSQDELKVLEYENDLDDYYKDAYGNAINHEQACPVAKHITELFRSSSSSPNGQKVILHFSHAGAVKKVYPMFGLFRDKGKLRADGICSQSSREWKSSLIAPFTSNILFILYDCGNEQKVAAFHNEKPVVIKGCSQHLCPLQDFYDTYEPIGKNCELQSLCCSCCS